MDSHLTVELGTGGRLYGTIHATSTSETQSFWGAFELVARLEELPGADSGDVQRRPVGSEGRPDPVAGSTSSPNLEGEGQ